MKTFLVNTFLRYHNNLV